MPSLTVENYVKQIYLICASQEGRPAATGRIAAELEVSPGTVTSMLKTLSESQLVTYTPYEGTLLTAAGAALALRMLRRHRLIELFLVETLALDWSEVHEEAEHMEHAVSDRLIDRIDEYLGHPRVDPHGDPIPRADGSLETSAAQPLNTLPIGAEFRLERVLDQSVEFLGFLSEHALEIAATGQVTAHREEAGIVTIRVSGQDITIGNDAAAKMLVVAR